jgi:PAS domain S-box-containing protein
VTSEIDASRLNDATFRALLEAAPDGILLVDAHGAIVLANAQVEQLFGYTRDELVGQRVEILLPERFRSMHISHREIYVDQPETRPMGSQLDLWGVRRDGSEFPVEISLSPGVSDDAPLTTAVIRDVTERRRIEDTLRLSEERYRLLAEHAQDLIFRLDLTVKPPSFEYVSPSAIHAIGRSPEDFYADPQLFASIVHPGDRALWDEAIRSGDDRVITLRERWPDGEVRWCEHKLVPIRDEDGALVAVEGISRNVTERREAEEEQRRVVADIETQLERERIAHDLHDDIIQSTYAVGLGFHAARNNPGVTKEAALDRATADLNAVIADLRAYMERLSTGADTTAGDQVLRVRIETLLASGPARPQWTPEFALPSLRPEEGRQIFLLVKEMISNVWRHADADNAWLTIRTDDDGKSVFLEVRDDGVGFEHSEDRPGSYGLRGLDQRTADLGGAVTIDAAPGRGTRIEAHIPRKPGPLTIAAEPEPNERSNYEPQQAPAEGRINR